MNKIKILVCCHKPGAVYEDDVYTPIHLGRAVSKYTNEMMPMIGDDTGDSISEKNPYFCEATGIYWLWKNIHDVEYAGICHYRRYFMTARINSYVKNLSQRDKTVIMTQPATCIHDRWNNLLYYVSSEDACLLVDVIDKLHPEYVKSFIRYARSYYIYRYNMVLCKKTDYDKYAEWLFSILREMEKYVKLSGYKNSQRVFGYVAEFLTPLFFIYNQYHIIEVPVVEDGKVKNVSFRDKMVRFFLHICLFPLLKNRPISVDASVRNGLIADGIIVK